MQAPDPSATLVVTGGGRGITARCVVRLAERFGCQFVLLGRTRVDVPEPGWAAGCSDLTELRRRAVLESSSRGRRPEPEAVSRAVDAITARREVESTLRLVSAAGSAARYLSVDVADAAALSLALQPVLDVLGPRRGLIHGAGLLADGPIAHKTEASFDSVYRPKVDGLANLLRMMPIESLRWLVLFSSVAAFSGNPNQAEYALANEVLNKLAHCMNSRAGTGCHVVSLNWGPWDTGMVTPGLQALFADRGIRTIPASGGAEALAAELASGAQAPQIVLGDYRSTTGAPVPPRRAVYRVHRRLDLDANPFLVDHLLDGRPVCRPRQPPHGSRIPAKRSTRVIAWSAGPSFASFTESCSTRQYPPTW